MQQKGALTSSFGGKLAQVSCAPVLYHRIVYGPPPQGKFSLFVFYCCQRTWFGSEGENCGTGDEIRQENGVMSHEPQLNLVLHIVAASQHRKSYKVRNLK